jgi:catechol 1,2-dioxygenase
MPANLINKATIKELAAKAAGLDNDQGDPRLKEVFDRLLHDVMVAMDDLDVSMNESTS